MDASSLLEKLVGKGELNTSEGAKFEDVKSFVSTAPQELSVSVLKDFSSLAETGGLAEIKNKSGYLLGMLRQRLRSEAEAGSGAAVHAVNAIKDTSTRLS